MKQNHCQKFSILCKISTAFIASLLFPISAQATLRNWTGPESAQALWTNATYWGGAVPTLADQANLNNASTSVRIATGITAQASEFNLGRHAINTQLEMTGGSLDAPTHIYLGQYPDGEGLLTLSGGTITTAGDFAVGMQGQGTLFMNGGSISSKTFSIAEMGNAISGDVIALGGSISADDLFIGANGNMLMDNSTLTLTNDDRSRVNGYIASGALGGYFGSVEPLAVTYNASSNKTTVKAPDGRRSGIDAFPSSAFGQRSLSLDYSDVRKFSAAPAPGIHPRVFFNPEEIADIKDRLTNTEAGQAVAFHISLITGIMRNGASWYNALPSEVRTMPNGSKRFGNTGAVDTHTTYNGLVAGTGGGVGYNVLGEMSLEAFECLIHQGESGYDQRATNLATAQNAVAQWAISTGNTNMDAIGGQHYALCYDLNYWAMTTQQRKNIRHALAMSMPHSGSYIGVGVTPEANTSNWSTIDSSILNCMMAIEGECTVANDGIDASFFTNYVKDAMTSMYSYAAYGYYPDGSPYEGMGKNALTASNYIAFARRGYDVFGLPNFKNFVRSYAPSIVQPWGCAFPAYDVLGGSLNGLLASDFVGLRWAYPNDAAADFFGRNFKTIYLDTNGDWQEFYDYSKASFGSNYWCDMIPAAAFVCNSGSGTFTDQSKAVLNNQFDYTGLNSGVFVSRSGFDPNATMLQMHVRQDLGGHTTADRNSFTLSALGCVWMEIHHDVSQGTLQFHEMQESKFQSVPLVDGAAMWVTQLDGHKMRIPAKAAGWKSSDKACFFSGDATYAYTNQWFWQSYDATTTSVPWSGWTLEQTTPNDFRRSNNKIAEPIGNSPFYAYPHWQYPGKNEGIWKKPNIAMRQVYRTAGLVRGTKPYALIIDDIQKDDANHTYKWLAQLRHDHYDTTFSKDLVIVTGTNLPAGFNQATDVLLQEKTASSTRQLLVRVLRANGTPIQSAGSTGSTLAYIEQETDCTNTTWPRLCIERSGTVSPDFRVMLFPMTIGDVVPKTTWSTNLKPNDTLTITIGSQTDVMQFYSRPASVGGQTVTINEFVLKRAGTTLPLLDYRNQFEPMAKR